MPIYTCGLCLKPGLSTETTLGYCVAVSKTKWMFVCEECYNKGKMPDRFYCIECDQKRCSKTELRSIFGSKGTWVCIPCCKESDESYARLFRQAGGFCYLDKDKNELQYLPLDDQ